MIDAQKTSQLKLLIVSLPNDLGSRTIESNLVRIVGSSCDAKLFRFAAQDSDQIDQHISNTKNICRRIQDAFKLRREVRKAAKEGRWILFYNVSPALFSLGSWRGTRVFITMDWASRLFGDPLPVHRRLLSLIHKWIFHKCDGLLPMTAAMGKCLENGYRVHADKISVVPSLFDVDYFDPGTISSPKGPPRVLYVGGDVERKGGLLLYEAFGKSLNSMCTLTMITNHDFPPIKGLSLEQGVKYGTDRHRSLMRDHDVFILPTFRDSGPQVIGEAAASGLAVLTTKQALGATHVVNDGVNGFIGEDPLDCIDKLRMLLPNHNLIRKMREASIEHMRSHYSRKIICESYLSAMTKSSTR